MLIDYVMLRVIWWFLLGVLLVGFAVMDGFDLGVSMLLPILAKNDGEKRIMINSIGPVWEGNQVWLVLGAGAIFAAWPTIYAVSFSSFYFAMLLALAGLILRPVSFKFRSKQEGLLWRKCWDNLLWVSGFVPSLIFGVAVGNVMQGIPFHFNDNLRVFYTGDFLHLLNPFALLCGLTSVFMFCMHGGLYLAIKTHDPLCKRAIRASRLAALLLFVCFVCGGFVLMTFVKGYAVVGNIVHGAPSNPLHKVVSHTLGSWLSVYQHVPFAAIIPIMGLFSILGVVLFADRMPKCAFIFSGLSITSIIATVGVTLFPFLLPSSSQPNHSLLVWDASSSESTLCIMLVATLIFVPIILLYTAWIYRVLRGKVTDSSIQSNLNSY